MAIAEDAGAMTFLENSPSLSIDGMLMDSATIASVLREAQERTHVKELTLRNVAIDRVIAEAAESLFSQNRNWIKIDTIHCTITNILQTLEHNTTLMYFQISGNNIEDADMEQVAEIITHSNHTQPVLSLTANNIGCAIVSRFNYVMQCTVFHNFSSFLLLP